MLCLHLPALILTCKHDHPKTLVRLTRPSIIAKAIFVSVPTFLFALFVMETVLEDESFQPQVEDAFFELSPRFLLTRNREPLHNLYASLHTGRLPEVPSIPPSLGIFVLV